METTSAATTGLISLLLGTQCLFFFCFGIVWLVMFVLIIVSIVLWVLMLVDVARRPDDAFPSPGPNTKLIWVLVIALGSGVGALVYYIIVYRPMGAAKPSS